MTTAVREKPVLFAGPMVKAILDGRKTQTRRLVKPQPHPDADWMMQGPEDASEFSFGIEGVGEHDPINFFVDSRARTPYQVGDILWVRETWGEGWDSGAGFYTVLQPSGVDRPDKVFYRADGIECPSGGSWRPSIHMPRWAARLFLEVTDVRAERLQDISNADALAEGALEATHIDNIGAMTCDQARVAFSLLWDSLAKDGTRWQDNPWVWAYTFRKVDR